MTDLEFSTKKMKFLIINSNSSNILPVLVDTAGPASFHRYWAVENGKLHMKQEKITLQEMVVFNSLYGS